MSAERAFDLDEKALMQRAWEATGALHTEPMGQGGRMVTHQPAIVVAMAHFAVREMQRLADHLAVAKQPRRDTAYWRNAYETLVKQTGRDLNDGLGLDPRKAGI